MQNKFSVKNNSDSDANTKLKWLKEMEQHLLGRTIVGIRYLTNQETQDMGWENSALVLVLNDGSLIFPSTDDEGNNAGALFGQTRKGDSFEAPII